MEEKFLEEMLKMDIQDIDKDTLIDISEFEFDTTVPREERTGKIIAALKNPYCFRVGEIGVKLEFKENTDTLQTVFTNFLRQQKAGV